MKRPKRDPAKGTKLILAYEKELKNLVKEYERLVIKSLKISSGERNLEAPVINENLLSSSIATISSAITAAASTIVAQQVMKSYLQGDAYAKMHVKRVMPDIETGISFNLPVASETITHLNRRQNIAFKGISDAMSTRIHHEISTGIQSGESIDQMVGRIQKVSDTVGYTRAEAMARTETMNAVNQGAIDRYVKSGFTRVEWLAAEDERTCRRPIQHLGKLYMGCRGLDGTVFNISEVPPIPAHVNCRCTVIPVMNTREASALSSDPILHESKTPPRLAGNGDIWIEV
jgi:SPP1 gp7 family putative phage head morphogenesis protein